MDQLQAILDAPDSDSSDEDGNRVNEVDELIRSLSERPASIAGNTGQLDSPANNTVFTTNSITSQKDPFATTTFQRWSNNPPQHKSTKSASESSDLERILREHDDDDDDDDEDDDDDGEIDMPMMSQNYMNKITGRTAGNIVTNAANLDAINSISDDVQSLGGSTISTRPGQFLMNYQQQQHSSLSSDPNSQIYYNSNHYQYKTATTTTECIPEETPPISSPQRSNASNSYSSTVNSKSPLRKRGDGHHLTDLPKFSMSGRNLTLEEEKQEQIRQQQEMGGDYYEGGIKEEDDNDVMNHSQPTHMSSMVNSNTTSTINMSPSLRMKSTPPTTNYGARHSVEEWSVLQSILNEVDNEEDDDDESFSNFGSTNFENVTDATFGDGSMNLQNYNTTTGTQQLPMVPSSASLSSAPENKHPLFSLSTKSSKPLSSVQREHSNASSILDVDAILNSMDGDSDEEELGADLAKLDEIVARFSSPPSSSALRKRLPLSSSTTSVNVSHIGSSHDKKLQEKGGDIYEKSGGDITKKPVEESVSVELQPNDYSSWKRKQIDSMSVESSSPTKSIGGPSVPKSENKVGPSSPAASIKSLLTTTTTYNHLQRSQPAFNTTNDNMTESALKQAKNYERRLLRPGQRDIISPLMVKRRMKPRIELQTKSRSEKPVVPSSSLGQQQKKSITNSNAGAIGSTEGIHGHNPRFNFAGVIEVKPMKNISTELLQNSKKRQETIGLPTALAISSKFIAIGTQQGIILIFDLFEELRQQLGRSTEYGSNSDELSEQIGSVTSVDLSSNGENLVAGYANGTIVLWDIMKGVVIKSAEGLHPSPITSVRFISEKDLSLVSVDAGGLVNKINFTKTVLRWSSYNVETSCLLDGTAGQILAMHVLPSFSSAMQSSRHENKKGQYHPSIHRLVLLALSSERSSFAIAVEPNVNVLHRWAKPSEEQMNIGSFKTSIKGSSEDKDEKNLYPSSSIPQTFLPCLAWGWALVSGGEHYLTPILARAWGCSMQLLRANFPPFEEDPITGKVDNTMHWPAFGVHDEFDSSAPVVAMEWLGDRSLSFLTLTNEFTVVDTVMMTLTERLDFSGIKLVYAEFALSRKAQAPEASDEAKQNAESCLSTTFQNSIRSSDSRLLVLCQEEVKSISILGIRQRITALEDGGEWLEALAVALDHYENTIKSQEDRQRQQGGAIDDINHPRFVSRLRISDDEEWIADLLMRYLFICVENAPEPSNDEPSYLTTRNKSKGQSGTNMRIDLATSHFQMLAGVCIEFCITTQRLDLLFNDIYECFQKAGNTPIFLDVLEPYVLNDKLSFIAPEVMAQFVEHCKLANDVATVERCLLHMDVKVMDFDSILSLLRANEMYSALIHVFTHGLDDYVTPLEILFEAIFDSIDRDDISIPRRLDGSPQSDFERYGYKALLYLQHCFRGQSFPQGESVKPETRIDTLIPQLLRCLKRRAYSPSDTVSSSLHNLAANSKDNPSGQREQDYPYLHALILLDAKALIDTLDIIFFATDTHFTESSDIQENIDDWHDRLEFIVASDENEANMETETICPDRMDFARILSYLTSNLDSANAAMVKSTRVNSAKNYFYDFMAKLLLKGIVRTPPQLTVSILQRVSSSSDQQKTIKLLEIVPRNSYVRNDALEVVESFGMSRAALILHKGGVVDFLQGHCDSQDGDRHFKRVIECYLCDDDSDFRFEVFEYVKKECMGGSMTLLADDDNDFPQEKNVHEVLRHGLCHELPALINLQSVLSAQLVAEMYVEDLDTILKSIGTVEDGIVQFKLFHAVISGDLAKIDTVAAQVLLANFTIDHHQMYLEHMAKFHPNMVYHHLTSHNNYRVEDCLKLCQQYEIADAQAYLLERMGSVSSALQLMLKTLEGHMMTLKRVVRGLSLNTYDTGNITRRLSIGRHNDIINNGNSGSSLKNKEVQAVQQMLTVALDLCERNSGSSSRHSEHGSQLWFDVLDRLMNARGFLRLSRELPEHSATMLDVLSDLLRMTMQRMVSKVSLTDLVRKITTDHAGNRLGEFREMMTTLLTTYSSELQVCTSALDVMQHDVCNMSRAKHSLKVQGAKVERVIGQSNSSFSTVVTINCNGDATFVRANDESAKSQVLRDGTNKGSKGTALSRLRHRRQRQQDEKLKTRRAVQTHGQGMMMTMDEKRFAAGESSDTAFMARGIGVLSTAQHYGKLG